MPEQPGRACSGQLQQTRPALRLCGNWTALVLEKCGPAKRRFSTENFGTSPVTVLTKALKR